MENIEQIILGSILLELKTFEFVSGMIKPEMFYHENHLIIYKSFIRLHQKNIGIDLITVANDLRNSKELEKIGGAYYLSSLTSSIGSVSHLEYHVKIFVQEWIRREMNKKLQNSINLLIEPVTDINDVYNELSLSLENLFNVQTNDNRQINNIIQDRIQEIQYREPGKNIGIDTGHKTLNEVTGGWQAGDLIILAARPSMGKTALSLLFAKYPALKQNKRILYFSLEMPAERIADRIISLETSINSEKLQTNNLNSSEWASIYDCLDKYSDAKILINDKSGLTIEEIKSISIIENKKNKIDLLIIDYLQLIRYSLNNNKNTNDQVSHISKNIKELAKKLALPVIALSQLSRDVDKRAEKIPMLADLRDSGAIEQDADLVIFLYRSDYYFPESNQNEIDTIVAKNRNGRTGITKFYRNENWTHISDQPFDFIDNMPFN